MKIVVLGAGAMGCLYGGLLAESGNEVWLLDIWEEHISKIQEQGLYIRNKEGERVIRNIQATLHPDEIGEADLVLVFVKSTDTGRAILQNKQVFGMHTIVITLQNGLGNIEILNRFFHSDLVIGGITSHGATMLKAGKIQHAGEGETNIGELDGKQSERIFEIAKLFNQAQIYTEVSGNILGLIWGKLLVNVGINALTAITRFKNGQLLECPETEELMEIAIQEAYSVAKAKGVEIPYSDPVLHAKRICSVTAQNCSSMLQDILKNRKTEIEMINGAIIREGAKLGIKTPVNKVLTNLILAIQKNDSCISARIE